MKKETDIYERLATLEEKVGTIEEEKKEWRKLICDTIKHVIWGAFLLALSGLAYGRYLLPESLRKALSDWIQG